MKPTLFILCGFPFSGKSTLAREIVLSTGSAVHFCIDEFFEAHPDLLDEEERWDVVFQHGRELSCRALAEGKHVLFDATNYLRKERTKLKDMAEKCGGDCAVIYVDTPMQVARQRLEYNRKTKSRRDVTEEAWEEVTGDFQVPTADENTIVYRPSDDSEQWIQTYFGE
jgi:predicted kinase